MSTGKSPSAPVGTPGPWPIFLPPEMPLTETSPRSPPLDFGSMVMRVISLVAAGRVVRPVGAGVAGFVGEHLGVAELQRREIAVALEHARGDDAVGERERGIVFGDVTLCACAVVTSAANANVRKSRIFIRPFRSVTLCLCGRSRRL